jgi:hypothetical protein
MLAGRRPGRQWPGYPEHGEVIRMRADSASQAAGPAGAGLPRVATPDATVGFLRARHRSWAIIRLPDGTYRALRPWWGDQQIIRVRDPAELDGYLSALPPGSPIPSQSGNRCPI